MGLMDGKRTLIMGIANQRSIAWGITQALHREGAQLAFSYVPDDRDRMKRNIEKLLPQLDGVEDALLLPCDVSKTEDVEELFRQVDDAWGGLDVLVHSIAFASLEDLDGDFRDISWEGYALTQHISAYSLIEVSKHAKPLFEKSGGGSIMTLTYLAAERVVPKYNVMAVAKAALECNVRYLAADLGPDNIRVNAISAGPIRTLAASAVKGIRDFQTIVEERAPLRRNVTIDEVGNVGLFLASDLSACVTGEIIYADNGYNLLAV